MTGVGYDSRALGATMPLTDGQGMTGVPPIQSITVAGQLCYLSEERLSLGNIPQFSRARRMLVFTNRSQEHDVSFVWHVTSKVNTKVNAYRKIHLKCYDDSRFNTLLIFMMQRSEEV